MPDPVFLLPGEMHWAVEPNRISTLLGSCVAVCLHDPKRRTGGMNHYLLPTGTPGLSPGRAGDRATRELIHLATLSGSKPDDLTASIFGGGAVVGHLGSVATIGGFDIGARNIEMARRELEAAGIPVIHSEVGGRQGRRIDLNTATGVASTRLIQGSAGQQARDELAERFRTRKIGVLVVDDSSTVRRLITKAINASDDLEVIGEAENPFEARERILEQDPDVICLDIIMPKLDGLSFLKRIMQYKPIPTVIVSTIAKKGSVMRANVEAAGAVGVIDKEDLSLYRGLDVVQAELLPLLRKAAHTVIVKKESSDG
jgi:chemotaxis receptor (MCP) glutamine deamidase CheD/CheY-like chemotaxis protein